MDQTTAREKVRVARALGKLPGIDGAFRMGRLSYAKVRALTPVATSQNELNLLEIALAATGAQLERLCRGYGHALSDGNAVPPADLRIGHGRGFRFRTGYDRGPSNSVDSFGYA